MLFVHSPKLSSALFKAGKAHELLPLTAHPHGARPVVTERMWTRILTFLASGLGSRSRERPGPSSSDAWCAWGAATGECRQPPH